MTLDELEEDFKERASQPVNHARPKDSCCVRPSRPMGFLPGFGGMEQENTELILVDAGGGNLVWMVITEDGRTVPAEDWYNH